MNLISQTIMSIGYLFFIASVAPNMRAIWKNRHKLRGFSRFGVTATTVGLLFVQTSFVLDAAFLPFVIGFPNMIYWIILTFLLWRNYYNDNKLEIKRDIT